MFFNTRCYKSRIAITGQANGVIRKTRKMRCRLSLKSINDKYVAYTWLIDTGKMILLV